MNATAQVEPAQATTDLKSWRRGFVDLPREHGFEPLEIEGRLPAALHGTFYKNGPALFGTFGRPYRHWFDGDGAMIATRFEGGQAQGAVRITQSAGLAEERRLGKARFAGYGVTASPWWRRPMGKPKNVANTSVMLWQDRLLALWEGGLPTELDPESLHTLGETDLGGLIPHAMSAHPHAVPQRKASYNFGLRYGREALLDLFVLPDQGRAQHLKTIPLPFLPMVHDFIATERHLIFFIPPIRMQVLPLLLGLKPFSETLGWRPEQGTTVLVVDIDDPASVTRFEVEPFCLWHFANAFEQGGLLHVDYIRYPDFGTNRWLGSLVSGDPAPTRFGALHRATIDLKAKRFGSAEIYGKVAPEFPRVAPQAQAAPYRYVYAGAQSAEAAAEYAVQDGLLKIDVQTGAGELVLAGTDRWLGEPVFVPSGRAGEDAGYLIAQGYDAGQHRGFIAVHDARAPGPEPLARAWFDHHIPLGFHGIWADGRPTPAGP